MNKNYINNANEYTQCEFKEEIHDSSNSNSFLPNSFSSIPTLINLVGNNETNELNNKVDFAIVAEKISDKKEDNILNKLPLFFNYGNKVRIPKTIECAIKHSIPKPLLKKIHSKRDVAVEMCILFILQLSPTIFELTDGGRRKGWKSLSSKYLRELFSYDPTAYKYIINALISAENSPIIEFKENGKIGLKCNDYRFNQTFRNKRLVLYELKTEAALKLLKKHYLKLYVEARRNPICNNLIEIYPLLTLPTIEEIMIEAKRLIKLGYKSRKGKILTFLNKHPKVYFKNPELRSFVEDGIENFKHLTENGLMIPRIGSRKSGGRIVEAISHIPGWIRNLITVNGVSFDVWDLSCLHPNIAMYIYGGSREYLTHDVVAKESGVENDIVKIEHLSFFNKHPRQMEISHLFDYYLNTEPKMMKNIIDEKYRSKYGHKITSRKMFEKEVQIMTDVIKQLNDEGIYVIYIYDALACLPTHSERVKQVLNDTVLSHGVKTRAKLLIDEKLNPKYENSENMK